MGIPEAELSVVVLDEVVSVVFLEVLARRRRVGHEALLDRLLGIVVGAVCSLALREVERHVRQHLDRRIEQRGPLDAIRRQRRELEHEPPAEGVSDPLRALKAFVVERLEQVVDVRRNRPRWIPLRAAVAAKVRGKHAEPLGQPLLGEPPEATAVCVDAVHADDRRRAGVAPFVQLQQHYCSDAANAGIADSQWMIAPTSAAPSMGASP